MSEIDKIQAKLAYLKLWLGICVATVLSLFGWLFSNFQSASLSTELWALGAILGASYGVYRLDVRIRRLIEKLGEL